MGGAMDEFSTTDERTRYRLLPASTALASCTAGLFLASHHPLWPVAMAVLFTVCVAVFTRWPGLWALALPAALPVLNFSPWTGWLIFDEFDLLILASVAGGL